MKILIVEDDSISRKLLQKNLEKWGYRVEAATNGKEALEMFKKDHFHVVITDWMMPEMDGVELVKAIRSCKHPDYVYTIMLTAKNQKEDFIQGMEAGADDFISKPLDRDELRMRLRAGERIIELEQTLRRQNEMLQKLNERMSQDLQAAARIQQAFLPASTFKGDDLEICWKYIPCTELAGDTLNYFFLDPHHLIFFVLDVSGHGVSAALLAVTLVRLLTNRSEKNSLILEQGNVPREPGKVLEELNYLFQVDEQISQYFTIFYGLLNTTSGELQWASAGHPAPLYVASKTGEGQFLNAPSLPIGFAEKVQYPTHRLQLQPGDRIFVYTDGVTENKNGQGEDFGQEQFKSLAVNQQSQPLCKLLDEIVKKLRQWNGQAAFSDDVSILAVEFSRAQKT